MKANEWMVDEGFVDRLSFKDKYYLKELFSLLFKFIKTHPVPIRTTWDPKHKSIYFTVGSEDSFKFFIPVYVERDYEDFLRIAERKLFSLKPRYKCKVVEERELTSDEIAERVKIGEKIADLLGKNFLFEYEEKGMIERVFVPKDYVPNSFAPKDHFILDRNGKREMRLSGTSVNILPLSVFLKELRQLEEDDKLKREFIVNNSVFCKYLPEEEQTEERIEKKDKTFYYWFESIVPLMYKESIICIGRDEYRWGRYIFSFQSSRLREDCLSQLKKYRGIKCMEEDIDKLEVLYDE